MPAVSPPSLKPIDRNASPGLSSTLTGLSTSGVASYGPTKRGLLAATTGSSMLLAGLGKNGILPVLSRGISRRVAGCSGDASTGAARALGSSGRRIGAILTLLVTNNILCLLSTTGFSNAARYTARTLFLCRMAPQVTLPEVRGRKWLPEGSNRWTGHPFLPTST